MSRARFFARSALFGALSLLLVGSIHAAESRVEVRYLGLHSADAKVSVDRRNYRMRPGEVVKGKVMLVSATRSEAIIRVGGNVYRFAKGHKLGKLLPAEMVLKRDSAGMFVASGAVNGRPTRFLVDTGASFVTLSAARAKSLGVKYSKKRVIEVMTAASIEKAYLTTLESVRIGGIVRFDVPAVIMQGSQPAELLLGNSFLGTVSLGQKDELMLLADE